MNDESVTISELGHILSKLQAAQRGLGRVDGMKTVKQNLDYLIEDVKVRQSELKEDVK